MATAALERPAMRWAIAGLIAVLFAVANLPWQLDDYDQAKQAFTSFEMVEQGHWLYQHTPNEWAATKPPLVGWVSAAFFFLTHNWEIAWRLPSFVAAIALLSAVARYAACAYGSGPAVVAAAACGLNFFAVRLATLVRTDMPLALIIFLLGAQVWEKLKTNAAWRPRDRLIAFALLAAAMLIKGPIVIAFLLPGMVLFILLTPRGQMRLSCGWWPWVGAFAVFMIWVAAGVWTVPGFFEDVVLREFFGRFEGTHRAQPFYFYLPHLLYRFAPWSVLMIILAVVQLRGSSLREQWQRASPATRWLICWVVGAVIVMSFVPSKRADRIFPVVPPLCLLLAAQIAIAKPAARYPAFALALGCLTTAGYVAEKMLTGYRNDRAAFVRFGSAVCAETAQRNLRFAIVGGADESILLYLRSVSFTQFADAVDDFQEGKINAIVALEEKAPKLLARLPDAALSSIGASGAAGPYGNRYVLIVRTPAR